MQLPAHVDQLDRQILRIVQNDNQRTHQSIGDEIGLSASAVRRRLTQMRKSGVIERDVSIVNSSSYGVRFIVTVSFREETVDTYDQFDKQIRSTPEILQGYHVAGTDDYVLIVQGPSLEWYEAWSKESFMNNPAIKRYDTRVVWSCKKFETALPLL